MPSMRERLLAEARAVMKVTHSAAAMRRSEAEISGGPMKLVVLSAFCLRAGRDVYEGEFLHSPGDLTPNEAKIKIGQGLLRKCPAKPVEETEEAAPEETEEAEAAMAAGSSSELAEHADPEPVTRSRAGRKRGRK